MSGLDGEATEELVKQLSTQTQGGANPESEYSVAAVLAETSNAHSLQTLLQLLRSSSPHVQRSHAMLLQLLSACSHVQACRQAMLAAGAVDLLLHCVHTTIRPLLTASSTAAQANKGGSSGSSNPKEPTLGNSFTSDQLLLLLKILEALATEANGMATAAAAAGKGAAAAALEPHYSASAADSNQDAANGVSRSDSMLTGSSSALEVKQLADALALLERYGLPECGAVLARLLTALAQHSSSAQVGLLDHFMPALNLAQLDATASAGSSLPAMTCRSIGSGTDVAATATATTTTTVPSDTNAAGPSNLEGTAASDGSTVASDAHEQRVQLQGFLRLTEALTAADAISGATAAGVGFQELVLQRGIPAALADYLVTMFTRQPAEREDESSTTVVTDDTSVPESSSSISSSASPEPAAVAVSAPRGPAGGIGVMTPPPRLLLPYARSPSPVGVLLPPLPPSHPAAATQLCEQGSASWQAAVLQPGVSMALQLLRALVRGHEGIALILTAKPGLLPLLHLLEGVHGGSVLAPLAEALLHEIMLAGPGEVCEAVAGLREATKAAMRALAARKREVMLASLGLMQVGRWYCISSLLLFLLLS